MQAKNNAKKEEALALQKQREREEEEALDREIDYSEEERWFKLQKKLKRQELVALIRTQWVKDDKTLVSLFADVLEMIYTSITFCWQPEIVLGYHQFSRLLECLMILYQFLYEEKAESKIVQ